MRQTKFRGLTNSGKWVYGCLVYTANISSAIYYEIGEGSVKELHWVYVKKDSIGQFTGLTDKNGKEIYEGDIIRNYQTGESPNQPGEVSFEYGGWHYNCYHAEALPLDRIASESELIGTIQENPELLK